MNLAISVKEGNTNVLAISQIVRNVGKPLELLAENTFDRAPRYCAPSRTQ